MNLFDCIYGRNFKNELILSFHNKLIQIPQFKIAPVSYQILTIKHEEKAFLFKVPKHFEIIYGCKKRVVKF